MGREEGRGEGRRPRDPDALNVARALVWGTLGAIKLATLAYTAEAVLRPHQPKYKGKAMRIRALGYLGGLGLAPALWLRRGGGSYPVGADIAVSGPLLIDAAGNSLGIYDDARLDDVVHFINTAVYASLFGAVISERTSREFATAAAIVFAIVGELGWEAMEYGAEAVGFEGLGLSHQDTVSDIAAAFIGAAVAGTLTWRRWRPGAEPRV